MFDPEKKPSTWKSLHTRQKWLVSAVCQKYSYFVILALPVLPLPACHPSSSSLLDFCSVLFFIKFSVVDFTAHVLCCLVPCPCPASAHFQRVPCGDEAPSSHFHLAPSPT